MISQLSKREAMRRLFGEAKRRGISQELLREEIAPGQIHKRLSKATEMEINRVLHHLVGTCRRQRPALKKPEIPEPKEPITPEQQFVIRKLYDLLGYSQNGRMTFNKRIVKRFHPQTHSEGQKIIYPLIVMASKMMLERVEGCRSQGAGSRLTPWERGFLFTNEYPAEKELMKFIANKNKRGRRTMPRFCMIKFFEIINKYS